MAAPARKTCFVATVSSLSLLGANISVWWLVRSLKATKKAHKRREVELEAEVRRLHQRELNSTGELALLFSFWRGSRVHQLVKRCHRLAECNFLKHAASVAPSQGGSLHLDG